MTEFNTEKYTEKMAINGYQIMVDLGLTPVLLQKIWINLDKDPFTRFDYFELIKSCSGIDNPAKRNSELERMRKNGWLKSRFSKRKNFPKIRVYSLSKKSLDYWRIWGDFENPEGPLMKPKGKIIEKEKEVIKEINSTSKESFEGVY